MKTKAKIHKRTHIKGGLMNPLIALSIFMTLISVFAYVMQRLEVSRFEERGVKATGVVSQLSQTRGVGRSSGVLSLIHLKVTLPSGDVGRGAASRYLPTGVYQKVSVGDQLSVLYLADGVRPTGETGEFTVDEIILEDSIQFVQKQSKAFYMAIGFATLVVLLFFISMCGAMREKWLSRH